MINKELIKQVILDQRKMFLDVKGAFARSVLDVGDFEKAIFKTKEIIVITGVRRCGKSFLLRLIWQKIKKTTKASDNQFLYLNFEDERLLKFTSQDFSIVMEAFFELFDIKKQKRIYLFFDEIQEVKHWEKFLNRLRESSRYKIFISGSNASLLSREIATQLVGRNLTVQLHPFSFKEYLRATIKDFSLNDLYQAERKAVIKRSFNKYLQNGGFPEVIKTNFRPLLQDYLKNIIYRDIVLRHRIKYQATLREMVRFLIANTGTILSIKTISEILKIKNLMTVRNYLNYLEESFLFYLAPMYSFSVKKQIYNPDKIYLGDVGLYQELGFKFSQNKGKILENFVFNELKRKYSDVYYEKGVRNTEVDFIITEKNHLKMMIQVCFDLSNKLTHQREMNGIRNAMQRYKQRQAIILTYDQESEEDYQEGKIKIIPAWKFFLIND